MSSIRSRLFFGCPLIGAGVIAMVGAGASCPDSGINLTPGNNGLLNYGTGNTGVLTAGSATQVLPTTCSAPEP